MTHEELAKYNGQNVQPAYVAVSGIIYDVSESPMWQNGIHENIHQAGRDLTIDLKSAPHIAAIIERFPSVGRLESPEPLSAKGSKLPVVAGAIIILLILGWFLIR